MWGLSLVAAAQLAVHLVEVVLVVVLPGDALLIILIRDGRGSLIVLLLPRRDGELIRVRPEHVVMQSLVAVDARPVWHDGAVGELLNAEPLGAEATHLIDEIVVGLFDVVLDICPGEAERPEEPVESEEARVGRIWVLEVLLEALAVLAEALAELEELVGLLVVGNGVEFGRPDESLSGGEARAVRHFCLRKMFYVFQRIPSS